MLRAPEGRAVMRALIIAAILFVPVPAYALEIGARLPTRYGEVIVVKNDGGVKNWTTYFPYGSICHTDLDLKTWLVVKRIVGEQTLLVVDFGVESMRLSCPHGTETNTPYAQARRCRRWGGRNMGGVVSGVFNLESSGVSASDWRPRHDKHYHEA
jgi:hypothetical protein